MAQIGERRWRIAGLGAVVLAAAVVASGCGGGGRAVAPFVDDAVRIARGPAVVRPTPSFSTKVVAPRSVLRQPQVRPRPSQRLPASISSAAVDSEVVTAFVVCDALGFYFQNGYLPTASDWPNLLGGYVLSQIPTAKAYEIGGQLARVAGSPEPFEEAASLSYEFACAAF